MNNLQNFRGGYSPSERRQRTGLMLSPADSPKGGLRRFKMGGDSRGC